MGWQIQVPLTHILGGGVMVLPIETLLRAKVCALPLEYTADN